MVKQKDWKVVAVCIDLDWTEEPWENDSHYDVKSLQDAYAYLFSKAEVRRMKFFATSYEWYNKKKDIFEKGWIYDRALGWIHVYNVRADFIFDKSPLDEKTRPIKKLLDKKKGMINPLEIEEICYDKNLTFKFFRDITPRSVLVKNKGQVLKNLPKIRTDRIVLKPTKASGAEGVYIVGKDEDIGKIKGEHLLQEFVECKNMPSFGKYGVYDLRVIVSNGKIIDALYRISKPGVFTSNVSTGGGMKFVGPKGVPSKVLKEVKKIDEKFKNYGPRLYSADFVIDPNDNVWLIELNSKPGFFYYLQFNKKDTLTKFVNYLLDSIEKRIH